VLATVPIAAAGSLAAGSPAAGSPAAASRYPHPVRDLIARIEDGMARFGVPGVAVGVWYRGREYLRGLGVTNVDDPRPVDGDTAFRIASTTKTFTGTAMMRLVEQGRVDLDQRVIRYLPDLRTADPTVAARVTVRQLLNHTAGWLGDYYRDTGQGADALTRYVAGLADVPQLTAPGTVFGYNNAALSVAGLVIQEVVGKPYERAMRELLLDPLALHRSRFSAAEVGGDNIAMPHTVDEAPAAAPGLDAIPRALNAAGGLYSTAREQLRYARFHLGDGRVPGGTARLLSRHALLAMRSRPGPGGTLFVELDGAGVTWMLRPTAERVQVVQHGGDVGGQHSGFLLVPERDFALTVLTNSETGPFLLADLFVGDWALRRFAGVHNLPANPRRLPAAELAGYEGAYTLQQVGPDGALLGFVVDVVRDRGELAVQIDGEAALRLKFYRRDYVLTADPTGQPDGSRANFVRDASGEVAWLRLGGRLLRRGAPADRAATRSAAPRLRLPNAFSL
jgi:CubicO group peptidase (beta-lactamase class C family)